MTLDEILDNIYPLPPDSKSILNAHIKQVDFPKGHILLRADKIENKIYFIKKGIVRAFSQTPDSEITFWFGHEGSTAISMKSYVQNQKGYENIELLEHCELYEIKIQELQQLYKQNIDIANWGRKFAEQELIKTEERLISLQFKNATERYKELMRDHPHLLQRVQLGHIASYLGITQVSLSRIRADMK